MCLSYRQISVSHPSLGPPEQPNRLRPNSSEDPISRSRHSRVAVSFQIWATFLGSFKAKRFKSLQVWALTREKKLKTIERPNWETNFGTQFETAKELGDNSKHRERPAGSSWERWKETSGEVVNKRKSTMRHVIKKRHIGDKWQSQSCKVPRTITKN